MLAQTLGAHNGYVEIADVDAAIGRERDTLRSGPDVKASTVLCDALRYRFLRTGDLGDFEDSVNIAKNLPRPTFEDIGTASARRSQHLSASEDHWMRLHPWLEKHGYRLRSRFRPDWVPSWPAAKVSPIRASDHYRAKPGWIDAIRIEDSATVWLKLSPEDSSELEIAAFFISAPVRSDPRNHCCPLLDYLRPPLIEGKKQWLLVTPLLRRTLDPSPKTVEEMTRLLLDLAEGLSFMHDNNVAHRDICLINTMMDATDLIPGGWSAFAPGYYFHPDGMVSHAIRPKSRSQVAVKYYFIDFGLSSLFPSFSERKLVVGDIAQNLTVPELSKRVPYDAFALDMRMFGDMIRALQTEFAGLAFLTPVVNKLVSDTPSERANAREMLDCLRGTVAARSRYLLLLPLRSRRASNLWAWLCYPLRLLSSAVPRRIPRDPSSSASAKPVPPPKRVPFSPIDRKVAIARP